MASNSLEATSKQDVLGASASVTTVSPNLSAFFNTTTSMASPATTTNNSTTPAPQPDPREASISIRDYIYFLPYPIPDGIPIPYTIHLPDKNELELNPLPFEPTHTLVLTSINKTFVDLRIFRPIRQGDPPLPNTGGPLERLEWAFSGTSTSVATPDPYTASSRGSFGPDPDSRAWDGSVTRASWTHWIDSRYPVGTPSSQIPVDEALMFPLDPVRVLEHGQAKNLHTGIMQSHEEMWTDQEIKACRPAATAFCIVLRINLPEVKVRGVVVRLGQYCQGMLMHGGVVTVERWEFVEGDKADEGGKKEQGSWQRTVRIGDGFLPCGFTFNEETCLMGGKIEYGQHEWVVEERVEWESPEDDDE
ncbi:unnamed protein product [Periconia digitata]|uniref:Protein HRI1 n=1 Tax=Periconia digitata TaxID=1303443 RepID=A0A9W4UU37_9PLEO|nr:unnamed protein product [Periconia digitata]